MVDKKADFRIQQMSVMLIFVFVFFAIVGLFLINMQISGLKETRQSLEYQSTLSSIKTVADMPELNCDSSRTLCLDEDKLFIFSSSSNGYSNFWPVASIKVRKIYPQPTEQIKCPAINCTFYDIYNSGQENVQEFGTFVNICKKIKNAGIVQENCVLGRIELGMKIFA